MTTNKMTVSVEILGKTYQFKCPENDVEALKKAAMVLDQKMQTVRDAGGVINFDRVAVLAALNLAHQTFCLEQQSNQVIQTVNQKLRDLQEKVEAALAHNSQMELSTE